VVDGLESKAYDGFLRGSNFVFDSATMLHALAGRENENLLVEMDIVEE
jgi:hypothetical protein